MEEREGLDDGDVEEDDALVIMALLSNCFAPLNDAADEAKSPKEFSPL